jgi:hypothetical protein
VIKGDFWPLCQQCFAVLFTILTPLTLVNNYLSVEGNIKASHPCKVAGLKITIDESVYKAPLTLTTDLKSAAFCMLAIHVCSVTSAHLKHCAHCIDIAPKEDLMYDVAQLLS